MLLNLRGLVLATLSFTEISADSRYRSHCDQPNLRTLLRTLWLSQTKIANDSLKQREELNKMEQKTLNGSKVNLQMAGKNEVVLVTGGCGFLGQHIVKLLQEKSESVREIRVLDLQEYVNKLGHSESKPIKSIVGDIRQVSDVHEALRDVDAVIHTAGLVSFGTSPDLQGMEEINVKGTSNLIQACIRQGVSRFIYTSTIDVVIGYDDIMDGDETTPIPRKFLFPGYPDTKYRAEQMVLAAHGRPLMNDEKDFTLEVCRNRQNDRIYAKKKKSIHPSQLYHDRCRFSKKLMVSAGVSWQGKTRIHFINTEKVKVNSYSYRSLLERGNGDNLRTLALRPNVMYGEEDPYYVTSALKMAKSKNGVLHRVGDGTAQFQQAYVGNMAWAHVTANDALSRDPRAGGHVYFVTDDTPVMNTFDFMAPFLQKRGFALSTYKVPYLLAYGILFAREMILWAIRPVYNVNLDNPLCSVIYVNKTFYFNRSKAARQLGYEPIYCYNRSFLKAASYYERVQLD